MYIILWIHENIQTCFSHVTLPVYKILITFLNILFFKIHVLDL